MQMGYAKRKGTFEYVQNVQIHIILCMYKVSPGPLLSIVHSIVSTDSGPEILKLFSCSTQLSMKFCMLINIK